VAEEKKRLRVFVETCTVLLEKRLRATLNLPADKAAELARDLVHDICVEHGGRYMYVVKDYEYTLGPRDLEIYRMFNGRNIIEVTDKFGITHTRVYQIVKAVHAVELAKRQSQLPGLDA
jgi:Mor family transcriptional regulator